MNCALTFVDPRVFFFVRFSICVLASANAHLITVQCALAALSSALVISNAVCNDWISATRSGTFLSQSLVRGMLSNELELDGIVASVDGARECNDCNQVTWVGSGKDIIASKSWSC